MGLSDELNHHAAETFRLRWDTRSGRVVPTPADLKLSNEAIHFERATVLYADLSGSTDMVDSVGWDRAAEIYKSYLYCAAKIIKAQGGVITSYDGDRVMGVFIGDTQTTPAARCALMINWAVQTIINPALNKQYADNKILVSQVVGIDTSEIRAARTGVRGDNDIVWVGRAANYAAKLTEIKQSERTWVTEAAYNHMSDEAKYGGTNKTLMWKKFTWTEHDKSIIYGSTWRWSF